MSVIELHSQNDRPYSYTSRQYHKAVLSIFTIFLPVLDASDERCRKCASSAASVCNAYKRLSQNKTLTYTMISLHSCFVAGLTLIYCVWRDHRLFSYEIIEAMQSCSQILTIFGEKWPGAIKYRDIFDALSQSLLKMTMKPTESTKARRKSSSSQSTEHARPYDFGQGTRDPYDTTESLTQTVSQAEEPSMSQLVTDAVKDAFMEVDGEAPGGWQGWRMWNEMVIGHSNPESGPNFGLSDLASENLTNADWNANFDLEMQLDPLQNPAMQANGSAPSSYSNWNTDGYR